MRLHPIDRPRSWLLRLIFWLSKRTFGKVLAPYRVLYPRIPRLVVPNFLLLGLSHRGLSLPPRLCRLVEAATSRENGCGFCTDTHQLMGLREGMAPELFAELAQPRESALLDEREKAALAYVREISRDRRVRDETFERLTRLFEEREIAELCFLTGLTTYMNVMAVSLGLESDGLCALHLERRAPEELTPAR